MGSSDVVLGCWRYGQATYSGIHLESHQRGAAAIGLGEVVAGARLRNFA